MTVQVHLILGSGGARGIAHIGVIRALEERGFAEIEFVVAESREVDPERVENGDHLSAVETFAVQPRRAQRGRTEEVTGQHRDGIRIPFQQ